MLELLIIFLFGGIFLKAVGLGFCVAWGAAKIVASLLFAVAIPLLIGILMFAGGILLLVPVVLVLIAFGILKACL